jgi:MoxR-like ATPase
LGTYPLPEAQLDRFFMKISLGYPTAAEEGKMLYRFKDASPMASLTPVAEGADIIEIQKTVEQIHVNALINKYIVALVQSTRAQDDVMLGASPRASLCLFKAAQAWAMLNERDYVVPDDVIEMAPPVLEHRILLKQEAKLKKTLPTDIIERALETVKAEGA